MHLGLRPIALLCASLLAATVGEARAQPAPPQVPAPGAPVPSENPPASQNPPPEHAPGPPTNAPPATQNPPAATENPPAATENPPAATEPAKPTGPVVPFGGLVLQKGDRTPLAGIHVFLDDGNDFAAETLADGKFHFDAVPVGKHELHLRGNQIASADVEETLEAGKQLTVTYFVVAAERYTTTVRAEKIVRETVETRLSVQEITRIPGTQGDALKAVQNLPGVARSAFGIGQLVVWGSAPQDTRVYVDGVYIPVLYHFGGLRSTVQSEMVDSINFIPGGYDALYGRGLGGVVEVDTRAPRSDGYHGFVQLDIIDGSLMVQGPITKNISFAVALRRSWIDVFLPLITPNTFQLSPKYYDYQAKLQWRVTPRDDLDFFVFGSDDSVDVLVNNQVNPALSASLGTHIYFHRFLANWRHRFARHASLSVVGSVGYDVPFQVNAHFGNTTFSVDAETLEYNLRAIAHVTLTDFLRLDTGLDFEGNRWTINANAPASGMPREGGAMAGTFDLSKVSEDGTVYINGVAPYAMLHFAFFDGRLVIQPQLRLETYAFSGSSTYTIAAMTGTSSFTHAYFRPEPRLSLRWQFADRFAVKAAIGTYHQPPDPSAFLHLYGDPSIGPETSTHYVLGFEARLMPTLHVELTGFFKELSGLIVAAEKGGGPPISSDGEGRVYGGQLILRQELWKNFFGWVAYTLSRSERRDHADQAWHLFQYDQTHILTIVASYKLPRGYQVGIRFRYVTGNPTTPIVSAYANLSGDGDYTPIYGPPYSDRLGSFNQLDIRFDKTWTFNLWRLSIYLDIQNVYNASNPEGYQYNYNYTQRAPVSSLPFLPAFGIRGDF